MYISTYLHLPARDRPFPKVTDVTIRDICGVRLGLLEEVIAVSIRNTEAYAASVGGSVDPDVSAGVELYVARDAVLLPEI